LSLASLVRGFRVHLIAGQRLWAAISHFIYRSDDLGCTWERVCTLPIPFDARLRSCTRLSSRFFRAGVSHILEAEQRHLVIFAFHKIYRYDTFTGRLAPEAAPIIGSRPLAVCSDSEGVIYYGEYRSNKERSPVHIMASKDGGQSWYPVHRFEHVRHIHGVFRDPFTGWLWVTTGDRDSESGIWLTRDRFRSLEKILGGDQQTRVVQLLFSPTHVYFGSDTELEPNHIYRLKKATGKIKRLQKVDGSVFWGCTVGKAIFFSTVVEPSRVNRNPRACIWGSLDGLRWQCVATFMKDRLPGKLFQYGQVFFPAGVNNTDCLWFMPYATKEANVTRCVKMESLFS
jgi:hypothetical protein